MRRHVLWWLVAATVVLEGLGFVLLKWILLDHVSTAAPLQSRAHLSKPPSEPLHVPPQHQDTKEQAFPVRPAPTTSPHPRETLGCQRMRVANPFIPLQFLRVYGLWDNPLMLPSRNAEAILRCKTLKGCPAEPNLSAKPLSRALSLAAAKDTLSTWRAGGCNVCALLRTVPAVYATWLDRWHELYPHWDHYMFGSLSAVDVFVQRYFPLLETFYQRLPHRVQKADVLRLMVLYQFGGFYMDLDIAPASASIDSSAPCAQEHHLDQLLNDHPSCSIFVFHEAVLTEAEAQRNGRQYPIRKGVPEEQVRIANYVFGAAPRHAFVMHLLDRIKERAAGTVPRSDYDILYTTGPDIVSTVVAEAVRSGRFGDDLCVIQRPEDQKYFAHHVLGTWRGNRDTPQF